MISASIDGREASGQERGRGRDPISQDAKLKGSEADATLRAQALEAPSGVTVIHQKVRS
jgi:hypothetical protein